MPLKQLSRPLRLRVWGERACFTRPEMKVERVSYDVLTPSAARGVLEAILWKPEMRWIVERIDVLAPIRTTTIRRNEVGQTASVDALMSALGGNATRLGIDIEDARQQRAAVILCDVDYVITARITLSSKDNADNTFAKYECMFRRRAASGQCFHRPYLGTREFAANFAFVEENEPVASAIPLSRDLGWMLLDLDYSGKRPVPLFFNAKLEAGTVNVPDPASPEVRR